MDLTGLKGCVESALGRPVGDGRLELLAAVASIYEDEGVIVCGEARPLWCDCPSASVCWAGFPQEWQPGRDPNDAGDGAVALPWIGEHYHRGGLVTLGINLRDASGLCVEYEIAHTQIARLEAGYRTAHNGFWAYRSSRSAAAVLQSSRGLADLDIEDPPRLAFLI